MDKLVGQIDGLSRRQCSDLHAFAAEPLARSEVLNLELAQRMMALSLEIKREVAIFVDRSGQVLLVSVGQADKAPVFALQTRRWQHGYAGVRCIHTHPGGTAHLSEADLSALKNLRFDMMLVLAAEKDALRVAVAMLAPVEGALTKAQVVAAENLSWARFQALPLFEQLATCEAALIRQPTIATDSDKERAILVLQPEQRRQDEVEIVKRALLDCIWREEP